MSRCTVPLALSCLVALIASGSAAGQIAGVPALCADRAPATGASPYEAVAVPTSGPSGSASASDLHCIDLFASDRGGEASGVVAIRRPWSPFGVSVTADGQHRHRLEAWIARLPPAASLGPYSAFVAWATPMSLDPIVRLGEVVEGRNDLGEVSFNKYLVLVTAEPAADVAERSGPLVLRGRSPSSLMEAHDLMALAPSAEEAADPDPDHAHGGDWAMPPMYEGVPMLPGVMATRPRVAPLRLDVDPTALPPATQRQMVTLPDGGTLDLTAGFVRREIRGRRIVMLAFNGQIPGPLVRVREKSTIFVNFTNETPFPTAVHWHGIRLDNRFDGVPGVTQDHVLPGASFRYQIHFPDAGIYWYHPHHREDVQQELGLSGNLLVDPAAPTYYNPVNREEVVMLDDLLLGDTDLVPFGNESANYMLMGRFGNVFLTNGEPEYELDVRTGEVVRFFFTNASNTRTFNVSFRPSDAAGGAPLPIKVIGSDLGRYEREATSESVVLAPAERYVVEVHFPEPGRYAFTNHVQGINHRQGVFLDEVSVLGTIDVAGALGVPDHSASFRGLRTHGDVVADIDAFRPHFGREPDRALVLTLRADSLPMAIEQAMSLDRVYFNPVEWAGTMPDMNFATSGVEIAWILHDPATGAENRDIRWDYSVGDVVKIRITNDRGAFHAMQHPLHIHGQRFLVLEQDGVPNENLVWKDTVLLPAGSTTDILLELSNPGRWMVHCHIAEHLESGMSFVIDVRGN